MVTSIQLGNIFEQDGKFVVGGSGSGFDTESIVNDLTKARRLPAVTLENSIEKNTSIKAAFTEFEKALTTFQDAANFLRNPPGVQNDAQNVFQFRSGTVTSNTSVQGSTYLSVTAEAGADVRSYNISQITSVAEAKIQTTNAQTSTATTQAVFEAPTIYTGQTTVALAAGTINSTSGSAFVDVTLTGHGLSNGDVLNLSGLTSAIGGIPVDELNGEHRVIVLDTNTVRISTTSSATSTTASVDTTGNAHTGGTSAAITAGQLNTTATQSQVDITLTGHGFSGGETISIDGITSALGGIPASEINGTHTISVIDANTVRITTTTAATDTVASTDVGPSAGQFAAGDITLLRDPSSLAAGDISISSGNAYANITIANHGMASGDLFEISGLTAAIGGIPASELNGTHSVTVVDANTIRITTDTTATSSQVNTEAANANIGKTISLVDGDTLTDVATKFNAVSATTGIAASVVKTSPTQFDLVFNAITTGTDADFDLDNSGTTTVLADFSSALSNVTFSDTQAATNAVFTFDNLTITRQSNTVNDLIDNATLTIRQETPALTEVDITIGEDDSLVKAGILNFVSAYNELKFFESRLTELDKDNKPTKEAVLAGNSSVRLIYSRINDELTSAVSGVSSATVDRLASLGITFTDFPGDDTTPFTRNILNVDEASLDAVLASNFEDVRKIFEFDFESTDSNLQVFSRTNGLGINSFTLDIDQTNDSYKATYTTTSGPTTIDLNFSKLDGRGVVLTGQSGTVLEGLELIYSASNDVTGIGVTLTQGIGDRIWNSMKEILKEDTGLLDLETKSITDENTRLQKEIDRIDKIVERYRDQLLAEYAALEAAITTANTLLQTIAAQNAANEQRK